MKFNFISNEIDISDCFDKLDSTTQNLIKETERLDLEGEDAALMGRFEGIEVFSKMALEDGAITDEQWDRICAKYSYNY